MSGDITIPPTFPGPVIVGIDPGSKGDASFFRIGGFRGGVRPLENPLPEANRVAGIVIPDPAISEKVQAYAKANGGTVDTFYGFTFVRMEDPARILWKVKLIGRLEGERRSAEREDRRRCGLPVLPYA